MAPRCAGGRNGAQKPSPRASGRRTGAGASRGTTARPRGGPRSGTARRAMSTPTRPARVQSGSSAERMPSLILATASGGRSAIFWASAVAVGSSSSWATTSRHEPDAHRLVGRDDVAGEQQAGGAVTADDGRQPADPAHIGAQAAQHEQLSELRLLGGDADVRHQRQLHAPPDSGAVDGGDHRDVRVEDGVGGGGQTRAW